MITFFIIYLFFFLSYTWYNTWILGYIGFFVYFWWSLFFCCGFLIYELYFFWIYSHWSETIWFKWGELGNNLIFFFSLQTDFFNSILLSTISSGALFVFGFVFIDMWDDKEGLKFGIQLGYFLLFMFIMITGANLFVLYLGWEGISLLSIILVSFWNERLRSLKAAFKIFFINKIGDFFLVIFIVHLLSNFGETDIYLLNFLSITSVYQNFFFFNNKIFFNEFLSFFLILSGSVKSTQIGFHIWLLEAMEAPLGASALMHSSTLVIAGIILMLKFYNFLSLSIYSSFLLLFLGTLTACFAAFCACFQYELKIILAYSTISNMGYLCTLLGIAGIIESLILIIAHAYIKIFLFLLVGGLILHCNGNQDIRWMGGLFKYTPVLFLMFSFTSIVLLGGPFWLGYFCKNFILNNLTNYWLIFTGSELLIFCSYLFTYFYNFRTILLIFFITKNGHRIIYKQKNLPLPLVVMYCILLSILSFFSYFLIIFIISNMYFLANFFIINIQKTICSTIQTLSSFSYKIWFLIYVIILLFFYFWNLIQRIKNFFFAWFFFFNIFLIIFFYVFSIPIFTKFNIVFCIIYTPIFLAIHFFIP